MHTLHHLYNHTYIHTYIYIYIIYIPEGPGLLRWHVVLWGGVGWGGGGINVHEHVRTCVMVLLDVSDGKVWGGVGWEGGN